MEQDGATLLIFYIPEAHRSEKPVYLNGDIRRSFVRKGGCDVRCSDNERNRFLVDAATERYDGQPVDFDLNAAFDLESIKWYRATYENKPGNRSYAALSDSEFLDQMVCWLTEAEAKFLRAQRYFCLALMQVFGKSCRGQWWTASDSFQVALILVSATAGMIGLCLTRISRLPGNHLWIGIASSQISLFGLTPFLCNEKTPQ